MKKEKRVGGGGVGESSFNQTIVGSTEVARS